MRTGRGTQDSVTLHLTPNGLVPLPVGGAIASTFNSMPPVASESLYLLHDLAYDSGSVNIGQHAFDKFQSV